MRKLLLFALVVSQLLSVQVVVAQVSAPPIVPPIPIPIPTPPNLPYPTTFQPTFQWNYACPNTVGSGCSITCQPNSLGFVLAAQVWLGTSSVANKSVPSIYYYYVYSTGTATLSGSGFVQNSTILSCQVNGLTITYSGLPK
jgi:hypothetical protein